MMRRLPSILQLALWFTLLMFAWLMIMLDAPILWVWALAAGWLAVLGVSFAMVKKTPFSVRREAEPVAAAGAPYQMTLLITNNSSRPVHLRFTDHYPQSFSQHSLPAKAEIAAGAVLRFSYTLTPAARGGTAFTAVQLRRRAGLWIEDQRIDCTHAVRVYPNFRRQQTERFTGRLNRRGALIHPLSAGSSQGDFSHLRDYREGDSLRRIDHKASARLGRLVSREFLEEFEQPLALLLDASERMQGGLLDAALEAAAQLVKTAARQGDAVSAAAFSAREKFYLPPRHKGQYSRLMDAYAELEADALPPDYLEAAERHFRRQKKPALTVIVTSLEAGDAQVLQKALRLMSRRHHVMVVSLLSPYLDAGGRAKDAFDAAALAARDMYANRFFDMQQHLREDALRFIACRPEALTATLLDAYWQYRLHLGRSA